MNVPALRFDQVFSLDNIREVVEVYDERWSRGGLNARGGAGPTRYEWFDSTTAAERTKEVYEAAQGLKTQGWSWPDLLEVLVPKDLVLPDYMAVGDFLKPSKNKGRTRRICVADPVTQAVQYVFSEAIKGCIEARLSNHAIAYREGLPMLVAFKNVIRFVRDRRLYAAAILDIETYYDSIRWTLLDQVVDTLDLDGDIRRVLKALYRVQVVDAHGRLVPREGGVPQGLVLAPALANLFLAAFDVKVQRIIGKWGVHLWRYADDIALFAPSREALKKAVAVVRTELGQLRLKVKEGTGAINDLKNPNNHPRWLGFLVGRDDLRADPEKLQAKAKRLLLLRERGELDDDDLAHRLDDLQRYYERAGLHPARAGEAAAFIENVLNNHYPTPRKEGIQHIRRQLRPRKMATSTSSPIGTEGDERVPFEEVHLEDGREDGPRFPLLCQSPHGLGLQEGPPGASLHNGLEVQWEAGPLRVVTPPGVDRAHGEVTPSAGLLPPLSPHGAGEVDRPGAPGGPVAAPYSLVGPDLRPPTSSEPAGLPRRRAYKDYKGERVVAAIESPWTVVVHGHAGPVEVTAPKHKVMKLPLKVSAAKSATEVHLEGYVEAVGLLRSRGALWVTLRVTDRTLDGYIAHGWRIGKPHIRRRLAELEAAIDELEADGAAVWFELADGRLVHAGRHHPFGLRGPTKTATSSRSG